MTQKKVGLARALSKMGYCSRSQAAILIRAGRVKLNGQPTLDPERPARIPHDRITVDGAPLAKPAPIYLVMNKPRGVVTTARDEDEKDRSTVYDLLPPGSPWVGPVGRLDKASEGLLLLTNDSEWAARITAPSSHLDKKYHVQVDCVANAALLKAITRADAAKRDSAVSTPVEYSFEKDSRNADPRKVDLRDEDLRAKHARFLRHGAKNSWLEITLDEGRNRQIRRLLESLGVRVLRLVRVSIGPIELGDLKKGVVRPLTHEEKNAVDRTLRSRKSSGNQKILRRNANCNVSASKETKLSAD
jgi:23S rRNA pseudouridine2605 synthase